MGAVGHVYWTSVSPSSEAATDGGKVRERLNGLLNAGGRMSATEDARTGAQECPFSEDYHAWVADERGYVRGYRVDATCGECDSQLEARVEEHTFVFSCHEYVEWGGDRSATGRLQALSSGAQAFRTD